MAEKLSLEDIKPRIVTVEVSNAVTNQAWVVDIALPTLTEWNNAQFGMEFPVAPKLQRMKNGAKEDYTDFNDPDFLRARELAIEELNMRRVTQALLKAGNFTKELDGLSLPDATKKLCNLADRDFLRGVFQALVSLINGTKGGVEAKKAAFPDHAVSEIDSEDLRLETLENR